MKKTMKLMKDIKDKPNKWFVFIDMKTQYYQNVSSSNLIYRFNVKRMRGQFRVGNSIPKHTCGKELIQNIQKVLKTQQ